MKRMIYLSLLTFSAFILFSYSNGTFTADYTGSTGLGQGCAQLGCHDGAGGTQGADSSRLVVRVLNASNVDVDAYTLGMQYNIEVKFKLLGATRVGFQCPSLFLFSAAKAGTVANTTMPTLVQMYTDPSGREYMSHTSLGTGSAVFSGGYAIWKYKWTAPMVASDAIAFHCAVNRTNNDNASTGDSIFQYNKILQKPTAVSDWSLHQDISVYPNPCKQLLHIDMADESFSQASIVDLSGRQVLAKELNSTSTNWDMASLPSGNYILLLNNGTITLSKLFSKD